MVCRLQYGCSSHRKTYPHHDRSTTGRDTLIVHRSTDFERAGPIAVKIVGGSEFGWQPRITAYLQNDGTVVRWSGQR